MFLPKVCTVDRIARVGKEQTAIDPRIRLRVSGNLASVGKSASVNVCSDARQPRRNRMLGSAAEVDLFDITLSDTEVDGGDSETG